MTEREESLGGVSNSLITMTEEAPVVNKNKRHRKEKRGLFYFSMHPKLTCRQSVGHGRH